jgi:signal transduction histidine kinase
MEASRRLMHIILWLTIISFVVVVFLLAVVYRNGKRRKAMNKELLQKQQALKASKKELEQVNASKDRLFSIISHDLRSPVATMSGLSDILKQYLDNNQIDEARELNKSIYDTLESIEFMLNNLLHWSVNQQNILNTNKEIFDLIPFASKLTKAYNQTAIIKQIDLRFETELQTFVIESDINSWGIVIRNLVNNALKFTKPGGQVVVGISIQENSAVLDVTDNGVGMDAEQLGSLFKLTEQKPSWGTRNEKGQGLGLILTNEFVSRNNGYINVTSEPDKGTHFKIIIPVAIHHVQTVSESYTIPAEHSVPQTKAGTQSTLLP